MAKPSWIWRETAEVIGVLGILAGIVFLGYELRQNTMAVRSEAAQELHNQIRSAYEFLVSDSILPAVLVGFEDPSNLSVEDVVRFESFMTVAFQAYQNIYVQVQEGTYDTELADGWWQLLRNDMEYPGVIAMWEQRKFINSPEFRDFVDNYVMQLEPNTSRTGAR